MHGRLTGARVILPRLAAAVTAHLARADDIRAVLRGRSRSRARAPLGCPFCTPARCSRSARRGGLPSLPVTHRRAPDCGGAGTEAARKRRGFCAGDARRFAAKRAPSPASPRPPRRSARLEPARVRAVLRGGAGRGIEERLAAARAAFVRDGRVAGSESPRCGAQCRVANRLLRFLSKSQGPV